MLVLSRRGVLLSLPLLSLCEFVITRLLMFADLIVVDLSFRLTPLWLCGIFAVSCYHLICFGCDDVHSFVHVVPCVWITPRNSFP